MKVVFLDVDGVLNHAAAFGRWSHLGTDCLDPECVDSLRGLVLGTEAVVVLSSTWRLMREADALIRVVLHLNRIAVVGATPDLGAGINDVTRGAEIRAWLDETPGVETYVILDDDPLAGAGHGDRLVLTRMDDGGLTPALAGKARAILEGRR